MKYKKILLILSIILAAIFIFSIKVEAANLELKKLDYQVELNSDGSANVTETWNIYMEDTNTLFKTFEIDKKKYGEITNVTVAEITGGSKRQYRQISQEMYHVPKGSYYALINKNSQFEIAWGVQEKEETKTYEISYKIIDAVKNYNDCSEFYWQFISTQSEIPARKVHGTIKLPRSVYDEKEFRVWAHGPLNGNITKTSNDTVEFDVDNLKAKTMLEARVVTPRETFLGNLNSEYTNKLQSILNQEQKWAEEANEQREKIAKQQETVKRVFIVILVATNLIGMVIAIILIKKIIKYKTFLKENPKLEPEQKLDYFREIPDESATPAQAALLYYLGNNNGIKMHIPKVVSATMLDLCLKKYIEFEIIADKKEEVKIIIKPEQNAQYLAQDERVVYDILVKIPKEGNSFTIKEFEKYCNKNADTITSELNSMDKKAKEEQEKKKNYSKEIVQQGINWEGKGIGFIFLTIISFFGMWLAIIPAIIATIYVYKISSGFKGFTQKGINEKEQWVGLKKYMDDFSMIDKKTVPELILWEKYLVYATAFGSAEQVLKQLKVVYPQITDVNYMRSHGYTYMYLMYSNGINHSFINTLSNSVTTTYHNTTNYSSGSGSGGGFSGGGGFGGGGGRNGRKIIKHEKQKVKAKVEKLNILCFFYYKNYKNAYNKEIGGMFMIKIIELPYTLTSLEPYYNKETLDIHYNVLYKGYVDNTNKTGEKLAKARLENDFSSIKCLERDLAFFGSGAILHQMFFENIGIPMPSMPSNPLMEQIIKDFGSFDQFQNQFIEAAKAVEASGWCLLVWVPKFNKLEILQAEKHQNLTLWGCTPLLVVDMWEHSYFLQYKANRAEYINALKNIINWKVVNKRYEEMI